MNGNGSTNRPWGAIWINILFGIWVAASPFRLGFARNHPICWNNVAVGVAVIILNLANKRGFGLIRALLVLLGAWLFISPFVLGVSKTIISWNNLVMGLLIIIGSVLTEAMRPTNAPAGSQPR